MNHKILQHAVVFSSRVFWRFAHTNGSFTRIKCEEGCGISRRVQNAVSLDNRCCEEEQLNPVTSTSQNQRFLLHGNVKHSSVLLNCTHPQMTTVVSSVPDSFEICKERSSRLNKFQEVTAAPLLLVEGCLHKVCRQRTFAFDICRTSALTFVPGSHQNLGSVLRHLHNTDGRTTVGKYTSDNIRGKYSRKNKWQSRIKAEGTNQDVEFSETMKLVTGAEKMLSLALRQFYDSLNRSKIETLNMAQPVSVKYHNWKKVEGGSDESNNTKNPTYLKGSKALMLCARAHKNVGYAMHFLHRATNTASKHEERQVDHTKHVAKAVSFLEAADGNLKLLFKHLQTSTRGKFDGDTRRGRKEGGNSGAGPRSLALKGQNTNGGDHHSFHTLSSSKQLFPRAMSNTGSKPLARREDNSHVGRRSFHTFTSNNEKFFQTHFGYPLKILMANFADRKSQKDKKIRVQEIEILALLSQVENLGRFLQEIHDTQVLQGESKALIEREIEIMVLLLKAHKKLCEIITQMNLIISSGEERSYGDRRIKVLTKFQKNKKHKQDNIFDQMIKISDTKKIARRQSKLKAMKGKQKSTGKKSEEKLAKNKMGSKGQEITECSEKKEDNDPEKSQ